MGHCEFAKAEEVTPTSGVFLTYVEMGIIVCGLIVTICATFGIDE